MKNTNVKCRQCEKIIGKLNTEGKPIFKTLKEGVVEYNGLFCSEDCFNEFAELNRENVSEEFHKWMNGWADFNKHKECLDSKYTIGNDKRPNHITEFGRGYQQAVRDIFDRIRLSNQSPPVRTQSQSDCPKENLI